MVSSPGCTELKRKPHLDASAEVGPARDGAIEGRDGATEIRPDSAGDRPACADAGTISCGQGACARTVQACVNGQPQTCTPGTPTTETCNGMDDDCDGVVDNGLGTMSCGQGACARTVQACVNGQPQTCTPGTPTSETCNGMDDDCDGVVDNGAPAALCPFTSQVATTGCFTGACHILTCGSGAFDVDGQYANGCECLDDLNGAACATPTNLGSMNAGDPAITAIGRVPDPNASDWFTIQFPSNRNAGELGAVAGAPDIKLSVNEGDAFRLEVKADCGSAQLGCLLQDAGVTEDAGSAAGITEWQFSDTCQGDTNPGACSARNVAWPSTVIFRVFRRTPGATCASYNVAITR
jgi:hypothetical protein